MVPVLKQLYDLEHLSLGFNKLDGELTCGLLGPDKKLHELDLAHNRVEGSIPQCLLGSRALQELYLANNELTGSLPGVTEGSRLTVLSLFDQVSTTARRAVFCMVITFLSLTINTLQFNLVRQTASTCFPGSAQSSDTRRLQHTLVSRALLTQTDPDRESGAHWQA